MTLEQLKAEAYDCISQIELWQAKLREKNQQIANWKPLPEDAMEKKHEKN